MAKVAISFLFLFLAFNTNFMVYSSSFPFLSLFLQVANAKAALSATQRAAATLEAKLAQLEREKTRNVANRAREKEAFALMASCGLYGLAVRPAFDPSPTNITKAAGAVKKLSDAEEKRLRALEVQNTVRQKKENEAAAAAAAATGSTSATPGNGSSSGGESSKGRLSFVNNLEGALRRQPSAGNNKNGNSSAATAAAESNGDADGAVSSNGKLTSRVSSLGSSRVKGGRPGELDSLFDPASTSGSNFFSDDPLSPSESFSPSRTSRDNKTTGDSDKSGSIDGDDSSSSSSASSSRSKPGRLGGRIRNFMSSAANSSEQEKM